MSQRINRLFIKFKDSAFFIATLLPQFYVRLGIMLMRGKHLQDRMISLKSEGWNL